MQQKFGCFRTIVDLLLECTLWPDSGFVQPMFDRAPVTSEFDVLVFMLQGWGFGSLACLVLMRCEVCTC